MAILDWAAEAANITDNSTLVDSAFDVTNSFDLFTMKVACFHTVVEGDTLWSIATKIKKKEKLDILSS